MDSAALEHNLANIANEENLAVAIRAQGHPACTHAWAGGRPEGRGVVQKDVEVNDDEHQRTVG